MRFESEVFKHMEKIVSFVADQSMKALPFYIDLAGITYPDPAYHIKRDNSHIFVLEYIIEGSGTVEVNEAVFHPSKGDVYLLPAGSRHQYCASRENPFTKIWANVNGDFCHQIITMYGLSEHYYFENTDVYPLFREFLSVCENRELDRETQFDSCSVLFLRIIQKLARQVTAKRHKNEYAIAAKNFCDRNVYEKIGADDVARVVNLSVSQLNRIFHQEYSSTVYAYILNTKINTAKALLRSSSMAVNEIAYLLKFADEHYFTNIFKKKTGMTPTGWRKNS